MIERELQQGMRAAQVQFLADVVTMVFDRADADEEPLGDLFVGSVLGDQPEDSPFSRCQGLYSRFTLGARARAPVSVEQI